MSLARHKFVVPVLTVTTKKDYLRKISENCYKDLQNVLKIKLYCNKLKIFPKEKDFLRVFFSQHLESILISVGIFSTATVNRVKSWRTWGRQFSTKAAEKQPKFFVEINIEFFPFHNSKNSIFWHFISD